MFYQPHTRVSRPSSLAASPIVPLSNGSSQKQQKARFSLPQVVQQLEAEATAVLTPRMTHSIGNVWDQAAESIVFDLVRFDSPVAPAHGLIDPNSSFGITINQ
jgi:hypothetical protein